MRRTPVVLLLGFAYSAVASAQMPGTPSSKPMAKSDFVDFAETRMVQYYCEVDGSYMQCLGVDIRKDGSRCERLVREGAKECKQRLLASMPPSVSGRSQFSRYAGQFSQCLGLSVMTVAGKSFDEVDKCIAQGQSGPRRRN